MKTVLATARWWFSTRGDILSQASFSNGLIFFGSGDGRLYAADELTGSEVWHFQTRGEIEGAAAISSEHVIFGSGDENLYVLDKMSGHEEWRFQGRGPITSQPVIDELSVYFSCMDGAVYKLDLQSHREVWRFETKHPISASPVIYDAIIFFGGSDKYVHAVDAETGAEKWRFKTRGVIETTPTIGGDRLLLGGHDKSLHCLDLQKGNEIWSFSAGKIILSSPEISEGSVFFGSNDQFLYCLDIETGREKWRFAAGGEVRSSPVVNNGMVYFGSDDERLYAVDTQTGKLAWIMPMGSWVTAKPLVQNNTVYAGSHDGIMYAVPAEISATSMTGDTPASVVATPVYQPPLKNRVDFKPSFPARIYSHYQSPWRLFVMLTFTGYLYQLYWFYKSWKQYGLYRNLRIRAGLRTLGLLVPILTLYLTYDLFKKINHVLVSDKIKVFSIFLVTTAFLSLTSMPFTLPAFLASIGKLPETNTSWLFLYLISIASVIGANAVLIFVQHRLNFLWRQAMPGLPEKRFFSGGEKVVLAIFIPLTLIGWFFNFNKILFQSDEYLLPDYSSVVSTSENGWTTYKYPKGPNISISIPDSWKNLEIDPSDIEGSIDKIAGVPAPIIDNLKNPQYRYGMVLFAIEPDRKYYLDVKLSEFSIPRGSTAEEMSTKTINHYKNDPNLDPQSLSRARVDYPFGTGEIIKIKFKPVLNDPAPPSKVIFILNKGYRYFELDFFVPSNRDSEAQPLMEKIANSLYAF